MRRAIVAFVVGFAVLAAIGAVTLAKAPPRVVRSGTPGAKALEPAGANLIGQQTGERTVCQNNEVLPAGVTAIRLGIWGFFGELVHLRIYRGSQLITTGARAGNWTSSTVTVPVKPVHRKVANVRLCFVLGPTSESMLLLGPRTTVSDASALWTGAPPLAQLNTKKAELLPGRVVAEYLAPGRDSWWASILPVARRLGLGRAFSGTWIALLIAALMVGVGVLTVRLTLRELQ